MGNITRWDPFRELVDLQNTVDQLFERGLGRFGGRQNGGELFFPIDLYETENDVVVKASIPGVQPGDVDVTVNGDVLSIRAETKSEHEEKQPNYFRQERRYGSMHRALQLPVRVDADKAEAAFENGVLTLRLPKAAEARPKTIEVKAASATAAGS